MNRKGFTLIELIVIIIILGLIVIFSLPNITAGIEKQKKNEVILVAKDMVEKTKKILLANKAFYPEKGEVKVFSLNFIDKKNEIKDSPYGYLYNKQLSFVAVHNDNYNYKYYVYILICDCNKEKKSLEKPDLRKYNSPYVVGNNDENLSLYDFNNDGYLDGNDTDQNEHQIYDYTFKEKQNYEMSLIESESLNNATINYSNETPSKPNEKHINNIIKGRDEFESVKITGFYY